MKDSDKLKALLSHYNLTTSGFAAKIGLSEEKVLNQILTGTYKISKAVRMKIYKYCQDISAYWLSTGCGQMIIKDYKNKNIRPMTDGEKICCILDELAMTASKFADSVGVGKQTVYDIQRGKCRISRTVQKKIMDKYPNISREWLIAGEGGIYNAKNGTQTIGDNNIVNTTADAIAITKLQSEIEILKKDVEMWKSKCDALQQIVANQNKVIDILSKNHNEQQR